jgi:hypothetical protein
MEVVVERTTKSEKRWYPIVRALYKLQCFAKHAAMATSYAELQKLPVWEKGSEVVFVTSHGVLRGPVVILEKERQRRKGRKSRRREKERGRRIVFWLGLF